MITRDDWLAAVKEAANAPLPDSDALSLVELAEVFGVGRGAAQVRVDRLLAVGRAEQTSKLMRMKNGALRTVQAYRLLK